MTEPTVLTPEALASRWQTSPATIRKQLRDGALPGFKLGKDWRIPKDAIARIEGTTTAGAD